MLEQNTSSLENQLTQAQHRYIIFDLEGRNVFIKIFWNNCTLLSISVLEDELSRVREEREVQVRQLRGKIEQNTQSLQHQYSIQEAKVHVYTHCIKLILVSDSTPKFFFFGMYPMATTLPHVLVFSIPGSSTCHTKHLLNCFCMHSYFSLFSTVRCWSRWLSSSISCPPSRKRWRH